MKKVDVYWNLHKNIFSILDRKTRRVLTYRAKLVIKNAALIVNEKGRQRVLENKRKNVHAFIRGDSKLTWCEIPPDAVRIHYNPYVSANWTLSDRITKVCEVSDVWCLTGNDNKPQVFARCKTLES